MALRWRRTSSLPRPRLSALSPTALWSVNAWSALASVAWANRRILKPCRASHVGRMSVACWRSHAACCSLHAEWNVARCMLLDARCVVRAADRTLQCCAVSALRRPAGARAAPDGPLRHVPPQRVGSCSRLAHSSASPPTSAQRGRCASCTLCRAASIRIASHRIAPHRTASSVLRRVAVAIFESSHATVRHPASQQRTCGTRRARQRPCADRSRTTWHVACDVFHATQADRTRATSPPRSVRM